MCRLRWDLGAGVDEIHSNQFWLKKFLASSDFRRQIKLGLRKMALNQTLSKYNFTFFNENTVNILRQQPWPLQQCIIVENKSDLKHYTNRDKCIAAQRIQYQL